MRYATLLLLVSLTGAQEKNKPLDLTPRWTAGETHRRFHEFTLRVGGHIRREGKRERVNLTTEEKVAYLERVLAVSAGKPVYVKRTYETHATRRRVEFSGKPVTGGLRSSPLERKTVTLIDRAGAIEASDDVAENIDDIMLPLDGLLARKGVRIGETWTRKSGIGGVLRGAQLTCKALRLMKYKGHAAVKVKVELRLKTTFDGEVSDLKYKGYLYFATVLRKPLLVDLKGPAVIHRDGGTLRGTAHLVTRLEPLPEKVFPRHVPAPPVQLGAIEIPRKSTAQQALLKAQWRAGEKSVVVIAIVAKVQIGDQPDSLRGTHYFDIAYHEKILQVGAGRPSRIERTYTKHTRRISVLADGRRVDGAPERHPLAGKTFTFAPVDSIFVPTRPLPKRPRQIREPAAGADWELVLPGRVVKIGERWLTSFRTADAFDGLHLGRMRLTLAAVRGEYAFIKVEQNTFIRKGEGPLDGDFVWADTGVIQFSVAQGKVVRADVTSAPMDEKVLIGQTTIRTLRRIIP